MNWIRTPLTTVAFATSLFAARAVVAQDVPPAGFERDTEYAQRLAERGYREAADWKIKELAKGSSLTPEQKATLSFLEANLAVVAFDLEKNFQSALVLQAKAKKGLDEYLASSPKGPNAARARYLLGELGKKLGNKVIDQIRKETGGAEKIAQLQKMGDEAFKQAEEYFRERATQLAGAAQQAGPGTPVHNDWMASRYAVPDCQLSHANLFPENDDKRKRLLGSAVTGFEEFTLDCDNELIVWFEANVKWGTALRELGKINDAMDCFGQALGILYEANEDPQAPKTVAPPDAITPGQKQVILDAAVEVAKLRNKVKQPEEVVHVVGDVKRGIPDLAQYDRGAELLVELAIAYELLGKTELAVAEARRALSSRPSDKVADAALEILDRNNARGGDSGITFEQLLTPVKRAIDDHNGAEAVRQFQRALGRTRSDTQAAKFLPETLFIGGDVYDEMKRPLEAILLWEAVADQFPEHKRAEWALGKAGMLACSLYVQTKALWAEARAREIRDRLQNSYQDTLPAQAVNEAYIKAVQKVGGKDISELVKLLTDEAKRLGKTDPGFGAKANEAAVMLFNEAAQSKGAKREASRKDSEEWFQSYLEWAKAQNVIEPTQLQKLQEKWLNAEISVARMWLWEPGAKADKTLSVIQGIEDRVSKIGGTKRQNELEDLKIQADLKLGKLDAATQILEGLITKQPEASVTIRSAKRISDWVNDELNPKRKPDPQRIPGLVDAGLRYTKVWIANGEKQENRIDADAYNNGGVRMFTWGLQKNGIEKFPGTFMEVDQGKLSFKEPLDDSASFFSKAIAANEARPEGQFSPTFVRFRRAQALGVLGKLDDVEAEYAKIAESNGMLEPAAGGNYFDIKLSPELKQFGHQLLNEWAYTLAEKASRGDKKAGLLSMKISASVIKATDPGPNEGSKDFWFARYLNVYAAEKLGQYLTAENVIGSYLATDKELDKNKFGFKNKIMAILDRVKGRNTDAPLDIPKDEKAAAAPPPKPAPPPDKGAKPAAGPPQKKPEPPKGSPPSNSPSNGSPPDGKPK